MIDLVQAITNLDQSPELHAARLLILLNSFSEKDKPGSIEGLTKLAKLDFLLRYPVMLENALKAKGRSVRGVEVEEYERYSVESQMVRYRFGPWDHRYREFLNILVAKGLATISLEGRKIVIGITESGSTIADRLTQIDSFKAYSQRGKILKLHFDMTATNLMRFIYETFPEVISLRSNSMIPT